MKNIKVFGLGGLNEIGMNMYVIEIDDKIFVLDAGIKYTSGLSLGIDYILPDYDYLIKNRKRIVGLFLTHAHDLNMGAVADILTDIPDIKIYSSFLTLELLKLDLRKSNINPANVNLNEIKAHKTIKFKDITVFPLAVTHSVPESLAFVINTKYGAIVYTGDFCIDPEAKGSYAMDLGKLAYIGKKGVFLLLSDSMDVDKEGLTSPNNHLYDHIINVFEKYENRIIVNLSEDHIAVLQELLDASKVMHRKVIIMGSNLQNRINILKNNGYLNVADDLIGDLKDLEIRNAVVIISHTSEAPYVNIKKVIKGYDKFVKVDEKDTFYMLEPVTINTEKALSILMDDIAKTGCNVVSVGKKDYRPFHPSKQDILLLLNILKPKYFMPVRGNFRNMSLAASLAEKLGVKKKNLILRTNGEVTSFIDGKLLEKVDVMKLEPSLIDGKSSDDVGELVIKDREILGEQGIVLISATLDKMTKNLLHGPELTTKGFVFVKESSELLENARNLAEEIIKNNTLSGMVDYNHIKNEIRKDLSKYFSKETNIRPMVITVLQEV